MVKFVKVMALALAATQVLGLCGCTPEQVSGTWKPNAQQLDVKSDTLYVQKVENMPEDFILGMDASCVPSLEAGGVKYYDHDGTEKDYGS